jgi:hypothetical protein
MSMTGLRDKAVFYEQFIKDCSSGDLPVPDWFRRACKNINDDESLPYIISSLKELRIKELDGISTAFGKLQFKDKSEFVKNNESRIKSWFFNNGVHEIDGCTDKFRTRFRQKVKDILQSGSKKTVGKISLKTYINDFANWARPGAVEYGKEIKELQKLTGINIKKTKWAYALAAGPEHLFNLIKETVSRARPPRYQVIEKSESETVRLIVLGDLVTYILMSYVSYHVEPYLKNADGLYMYWTKEKQYKFWLNKILYTKSEYWNLDLDYSSWDEGITHDMINIICDELVDLFDSQYGKEQYVDYIRRSISSSIISGFGKSTSGLPSGSRWTTLINSIANSAILQISNELHEARTGDVDYMIHYAVAGDDSDCTLRSLSTCDGMMNELTKMGFTINKYKSKLSNKEGEFLKNTYNDVGVTGNPVRMLRSILWSVEDERYLYGDEKRIARINTWNQYLSRLRGNNITFDWKVVEQLIIDDMYGAFNRRFSKKKLKNCLRTQAAYGGIGIVPFRPTIITVLEWNVKTEDPDNKQLVLNTINKRIMPLSEKKRERLSNNLFDTITSSHYAIKSINLEELVWLDMSDEAVHTTMSYAVLGMQREMMPINHPPAPTDGHMYSTEFMYSEQPTKKELIESTPSIVDSNFESYTDTGIPMKFADYIKRNDRWVSRHMLRMMYSNELQNPSQPPILTQACGEMLTELFWNCSVSQFIIYLFLKEKSITAWITYRLMVENYFRQQARQSWRRSAYNIVFSRNVVLS